MPRTGLRTLTSLTLWQTDISVPFTVLVVQEEPLMLLVAMKPTRNAAKRPLGRRTLR